MPQLKDFRTSKEITLPSYPDSKVEIYDSLLVGDLLKLGHSSGEDLQIGIKVLPFLIKSWNFTNDDGTIMEIKLENLTFLKGPDLIALLGAITEFAKEGKKKELSSPELPTASA